MKKLKILDAFQWKKPKTSHFNLKIYINRSKQNSNWYPTLTQYILKQIKRSSIKKIEKIKINSFESGLETVLYSSYVEYLHNQKHTTIEAYDRSLWAWPPSAWCYMSLFL